MSLSSSPRGTPVVLEKFLRYVKLDTQSKHDAPTVPSTDTQFVLASMLVKELEELHLKDVSVDEHCYVMATLPSNCESSSPTLLGLLAHMDTSPDAPGEGVDPQIIRNYTGGDIVLPKDTTQVIPAVQLEPYKGMDIVTSDGTTLLGADDKAGMTMTITLLQFHPSCFPMKSTFILQH
jgi:tripeptide aminopeptidase